MPRSGYALIRSGYLTPKQLTFWSLRRQGLTQAEVSRKVGVTPQTTNKTFNAIDAKIYRALTDTAQLHRLDIRRIGLEEGFLLGYSPTWKTDALVTFSVANGVQVWYKGERLLRVHKTRELQTDSHKGERRARNLIAPRQGQDKPISTGG